MYCIYVYIFIVLLLLLIYYHATGLIGRKIVQTIRMLHTDGDAVLALLIFPPFIVAEATSKSHINLIFGASILNLRFKFWRLGFGTIENKLFQEKF